MVGIEKMVAAFDNASSFWDYCLAVENVGSTLWNYFSISALMEALETNMPWYDWIIRRFSHVGWHNCNHVLGLQWDGIGGRHSVECCWHRSAH